MPTPPEPEITNQQRRRLAYLHDVNRTAEAELEKTTYQRQAQQERETAKATVHIVRELREA